MRWMEIAVEGKDPGVYGGCAANVVLGWSGEVYPAEEREAYCPDSKVFVRLHLNVAHVSDCLC